MVIVTDFGDGGHITMTVDPKALGLRPVFSAKDAETSQPLTVIERQVRFNLKKHDFRMVILE